MKPLLFEDDQQFWFETLRLFGNASYGGTDFGEIMAAASTITPGDYDSWHDAYRSMADRLLAEAEIAHPVTRRDLLLRASSYAFTAGFFLHGTPSDPRVADTYHLSVRCFEEATVLCDPPVEAIRFPYDTVELSGYFYPGRGDGRQPTLLMHSGLDGGAEELHFQGALAAQERGYNVVTFDGPGQPSAIQNHGLTFRPDWEHPVKAVIDHVIRDPRVDPERIALLGMSFGGYLAPRAAAFEPRLAAVIACDGIFDASAAITQHLPWDRAETFERANAEEDLEMDLTLERFQSSGATARWAFAHGRYVLGANTDRQFLAQLMRYSLDDGVAEQIRCPVLICEAANDHFFTDKSLTEARRLYDRLTSPKTILDFTAEEGADAHCHVGAQRLLSGRILDWLDDTLAAT